MPKLNQKLGKESFAKLQSQLKDKGVKVITFNQDGFVTSDDVKGRVTSVFNLGKKLDFVTDIPAKKEAAAYKITQIQGDFYLMEAEAH